MKLTRINDFSWKIEKEGAMRVPAIIFASDKLMEKIKLDKTLHQATNVACLPGIQKHALTMPDAHEGYGFPIGGVAAFDQNESGVISPGGIGYDINCLTGDAKVSSEDGKISIRKFEKKMCKVSTLENRKFLESMPVAFMKFKPRNKVLRMVTECGDVIKATADHPILTKRGMVQLQYLKEGSKIATKDSKLEWNLVSDIREINYRGCVYDFTIPVTHNFVANNIVVSNCGVRLLTTNMTRESAKKNVDALLNITAKNVPAGLGSAGKIKATREELNEVLYKGSRWAVEHGFGWKEDLERHEENGEMRVNNLVVSADAMKRGMPQLGSLGSGNHFLELQYVEQIYDEKTAQTFGLKKDQLCVMIHCGSRGFGHQVCSDYLREMEQKFGDLSKLPDRELIYAPLGSELADRYFNAMSAAANFAWANRQMIMHWVREGFANIMKSTPEDLEMRLVYDVAHNIAKFEDHIIDGKKKTVCVHRKGATRSFGAGRKELPEIYRNTGQPVIIPGSMGTASYVLVGTKEAEQNTFGSTAHGAGRVMSRGEALSKFRGEQVRDDLKKKGISLRASGGWKGIAEEAPEVYKDIDEVVSVSDKARIGNLVAKLRPIGVIKG